MHYEKTGALFVLPAALASPVNEPKMRNAAATLGRTTWRAAALTSEHNKRVKKITQNKGYVHVGFTICGCVAHHR